MWVFARILGVIAHVVCIVNAGGPFIERLMIKKALGRALATERLFSVRDRTGVAVSVIHPAGLVALAEEDVVELVDVIMEVHASGVMDEKLTRDLSRKLQSMFDSNMNWEYLAVYPDEDDQELYHGMGKRFSSFLAYLLPHLGRSVELVSTTDPLEEKKIYEYLRRSVYNDMFDWIRRTNGRYPLDEKRLNFQSRLATTLLAKTAFEMINSDAISMDKRKLVISGLLNVATANGFNMVVFSNQDRRKRGEVIEDDPYYLGVTNYSKQQIVEFSKIVESLLDESSTVRKALETTRKEWLEKTKRLV